jgi:multidrug efflux system outer membrane protein
VVPIGLSRVWQFGPSVSLPVFNAGRNRANLRLTEVQHREAPIRYEQAFREVEDALVAHRKIRKGLAEPDTAVRASHEAFRIAELRDTSGLTGSLTVLGAPRTLLAAELAQSRTLGAHLVAVVQLYGVLGGGWAQDGGRARVP